MLISCDTQARWHGTRPPSTSPPAKSTLNGANPKKIANFLLITFVILLNGANPKKLQFFPLIIFVPQKNCELPSITLSIFAFLRGFQGSPSSLAELTFLEKVSAAKPFSSPDSQVPVWRAELWYEVWFLDLWCKTGEDG